MARGVRLNGWTGVAALFAVLSVAAWWVPRPWLDWQPALAGVHPWRAFSAAFVHWSALHLGANLLGVCVVALFGRTACLPPAAAWAWTAAWPLTQIGLLLQPDLLHYGGLSGVLHAGVAVAGTWLVIERRWVGAAVLAGLVLKVALEAPWGPALRVVVGWDIPLAPVAHATGAVAGVLCALGVQLTWGRHAGDPQCHPDAG